MKGYTLTEKSKKNLRVLKLFLISLLFVAIALSIAIIGCNYVINRNFKETFYTVSSLKVNDKIRVIQLSDLHNCAYGKNNKKLISRVKKLKPDMIIYTGDIMDADSKSNERTYHVCEALAKVAPSYYVYGNNEVKEYYDNPLTCKALDKKFGFNDKNRDPNKLLEETDAFEKNIESLGVKVLKNSAETITIGTTQVDIYGVLTSNPSSFWPYAGESFGEYLYTNEQNLKITAIHEPLIFKTYEPDSWGDLMLAGHTHGGVIRVPIIGPLYVSDVGFFPEREGHFAYGRFDVKGRPLIVNGGLENKNLLRINNQPEITIIDINKF